MASSKFITHLLEGVEISQRFNDGYLNATALSKAYFIKTGKHRKPSHWLENARTQETIRHLAQTAGIPAVSLVATIEGRNGGTYLHPRLSIRFGIWLDDDFGLAIEDFIAAHGREFAAFTSARAKGKATRNFEMAALKRIGFDKEGYYTSASQAVYRGILGMDAEGVRKGRGLPDGCNIRDHLTPAELSAIELLESQVPRIAAAHQGESFSVVYAEILARGQAMQSVLM